MIGGAVRWATSKVDENVVSPVTSRLANSVANPFVMSYFIWERIKEMTPQRARDLTRLFSVAVANAVGVFGAEKGQAFKASTQRLQDEFVGAAVSRQGREVLLNTVATASKVAQALNTPETKAATTQVFETLQSVIDFFASEPGRKVIATAGECLNQLCDVAASPESSIFLAEVATNVCHALDAEAQRRDAELDAASEAKQQQQRASNFSEMGEKPGMAPPSPTSSAADTVFETESNVSETPHFGRSRTSSRTTRSLNVRRRSTKRTETNASRSARIEKDVLLKMGVEPAMIGEIQRILDTIAADEETALMRIEDAAGIHSSDDDDDVIGFTDDDDGAESTISFAFGIRSPSPPPSFAAHDADNEQKADDAESTTGTVLPEWHEEPLRQALRRRHVRDAERVAERNTYATQAQAIATVLTERKTRHGTLAPADVMACRAISQMIVYCVACILLMVVYSVYRTLFY